MHLDVLELRDFYYRTQLGRVVQHAVRDQVLALWPDAKGLNMVGFGFAVPLLRPYLSAARRVIGLMPGQQGVMPWPAGMANVSVLCDERHWPVPMEFVDRLILMHGLETSDHPRSVLDACARALAPDGRVLFIVPNRAGLWARRDKTPFGFGRPYSLDQLEAQLKSHGFTPERHVAALFTPPTDTRFWLKTGQMWERLGRSLSPRWAGGVIMLEASKRTPAIPGAPAENGLRRPLRILEGMTQPEVKPI
ncbi:MAG: methyltransferase domain-containing protein [Pseudomonadota bacterium]